MNKKVMIVAALMLAVVGLEFSGCKKGNEDPGLSLKSRKARMTGEWTVVSFGDTNTYEGTSDYTYSDSDGDSYATTSEMTSTERMNFDGTYMSQYYMEETYSSTSSNGFVNTHTGEYEYTMEDGEFESSSKDTYTYSSGGSDIYTYDASGDHVSDVSITYTFEGDGTFSASIMTSNEVDYTYIQGGSTTSAEESESSTTIITGTWSFVGGNKADGFKNRERIALWYKTSKRTSESMDSETYSLWNYTYDNAYEGEYTYTASDTDADEIWELVMLKNKEMKVRRAYTHTDVDKDSYSYSDNDPYSENEDEDFTGTVTGSSTMMMTRD